MGRLKHSVLILGEGPTEFYYFNSLRDVFKGLTVKPDYPKHSSIKELEEKIESGIAEGYDRIFCVIDMDTKDAEPERTQYARLKKKYAQPVSKPKKGLYCEVRFFETHRCTEQFFLYYFRYTARAYNSQSELLLDLNKLCGYEKTIDYFRKSHGLHAYFEKRGGRLGAAVSNAKHSMEERLADGRAYTYSELGCMIEELRALI
jgi:hypothetical protein